MSLMKIEKARVMADYSSISRAPRNRMSKALAGALDIEVEHRDGILTCEPNEFMLACHNGEIERMKPIDRESFLSKEPALLYRSGDLEIALTGEQIHRLAMSALTPDEYGRLVEQFGKAFEWHEDFYDEASGRALQPKGKFFKEV